MNRKVITKVLATFLAFTLSFANVALLGSYMSEVYAGTIKLEEQETMVQKTDLEFDAYMKEEGKDVHSKTIDVAEESEILYLKIKAGEGYLTNASIKIENANFKIEEKEEELALIQSISSEENKIVLNQINKGESALIEIPIKINAGSSFDVKDLSKVAEIKLEGTYINNKGKEVKVNKTMEVETIIDGIAEANLSLEVSKYVSFNVSGSKGVILQTLLKSNLVDNKLPVKSTKLEIEIPKINNIEPKEIAISSRSEEATNGKKARVFNEEDYKNEERKTYISIRKRRRNAFMDEKCK
ncbi:MAG: hypothetical protein HFJ50_03875 [Clostridia bacterium]|jgi:hypothetical protein|nr:hypothetical protein [Clostridia bacterium]